MIREELADGQHGAFLVWGDPSLYDSTLRIVDQVAAMKTVAFELDVIPGITSVQALAARHKIALNRIGGPVHITTGRQLAKGMPGDDVVVMLDGDCAFKTVKDGGVDIYWGAYVGTADEILVSGKLRERGAGDREASAARRGRATAGSWTLICCGRTSAAYSPPRPRPAARRSRRSAPARPARRRSGRRSAACKATP